MRSGGVVSRGAACRGLRRTLNGKGLERQRTVVAYLKLLSGQSFGSTEEFHEEFKAGQQCRALGTQVARRPTNREWK